MLCKPTIVGLVALALSVSVSGAEKKRDWKTAKITDSRTVDTGTVTAPARSIGAAGPYAPPLPAVSRTITATELQITGQDYIYLVRDLGTNTFIKRLCRYIVGDDVKYVQDKSVFYLVDADGAECRAQVMKQERITPPVAK